jgi:hypothetical protein
MPGYEATECGSCSLGRATNPCCMAHIPRRGPQTHTNAPLRLSVSILLFRYRHTISVSHLTHVGEKHEQDSIVIPMSCPGCCLCKPVTIQGPCISTGVLLLRSDSQAGPHQKRTHTKTRRRSTAAFFPGSGVSTISLGSFVATWVAS